MEVIGYLESCFPDKFGTPRQPGLVPSSWARLKIDKKYQPEEALIGLSSFSHIWVIFLFHKNTNLRYHAKIHPPRLEGQSIGVFATRSPHRPNPIGLSLLKLEKIQGDFVYVSGVDLIDGTPIIDIKPYLPDVEAKPQALGGWTQKIDSTQIQICIEPEQEQLISKWSERIFQPQLRNIIFETLRQDPRPLVYRGYEGQIESPYRQIHAVRFFDGDVHFKFNNPKEIQIIKIISES